MLEEPLEAANRVPLAHLDDVQAESYSSSMQFTECCNLFSGVSAGFQGKDSL